MTSLDRKSDLAQRTANALKWNYLGVLVRTFSQLIIGIVLARLLGPEPFGIVAIAWLVIGICNLFADFGFAAALIQKTELNPKDVRFVFTMQLAAGIFFTGAGVGSAEYIANYFHRADATNPLRAMFLLFFFQALGQTSMSMLRRSLNFRVAQQISIASYLVGYLTVGLPLAFCGWGVWALVAAYLSQAMLSSFALIWFSNKGLGFALKPASPGLLAFGGKVVGANASSWALQNLDSVVIARTLGVVDLGLYNRATNLVAGPMAALVGGLQSVLFSACSKVQDHRQKVWRAYLGATVAVALLSLPLLLSVATVAETVVSGLYGDRWLDAARALRPIAAAAAVTALLAVAGPVLMSINQVAKELKAQIVTLVVMAPVLFFASKGGLAYVAWSVLAISLFRWLCLAAAVLSAVDGRWTDLIVSLGWPALMATGVAISVGAADWILRAHLANASLRLAVLVVPGCLALMVGARLMGQALMRGALGEFVLARGPLPISVQRLLGLRGQV